MAALSAGYYLNTKDLPTNCSYFDAAVPGTGPMGMVSAKAPSTDFEKFNSSFNYSLKSKSDYNLNPQPEGNVFSAYPKAYTQINATGVSQKQFQNRLQDDVRPTMKETTLFTYDGNVAPLKPSQAVYSQFIPEYAKINGKNVRINGASNFGLRTAAEYSYIPGAAPTGINGQAIQNPDAAIGKNTKPVADFNVDGPGTIKNALPDGGKYQQYRIISKPTSNGLKFNYNMETGDGSVSKFSVESGDSVKDFIPSYSPLLGKSVDGIENRYTSSYQIAPLFTNPLSMVWDPDNKGTIPPYFCSDQPVDYSYMTIQNLPSNDYVKGGYNSTWQKDDTKVSANAYILDMQQGNHNERLEWVQGVNNHTGVVYTPDTQNEKVNSSCYGGENSVYDQYISNLQNGYNNNTFTTLGDPLAGYIGQSVNQVVR